MAFLSAVKVAFRSSWTVLLLHLLFVSADFSFLILHCEEMVFWRNSEREIVVKIDFCRVAVSLSNSWCVYQVVFPVY